MPYRMRVTIHPGYPVPTDLQPMLYWGREVGQRPHDFLTRSPSWKKKAVALILRNGHDATPGIHALGWANCRICNADLGSLDLTRFGFVWPEKAEHYIMKHDVWTPECDDLLRAALREAT